MLNNEYSENELMDEIHRMSDDELTLLWATLANKSFTKLVKNTRLIVAPKSVRYCLYLDNLLFTLSYSYNKEMNQYSISMRRTDYWKGIISEYKNKP